MFFQALDRLLLSSPSPERAERQHRRRRSANQRRGDRHNANSRRDLADLLNSHVPPNTANSNSQTNDSQVDSTNQGSGNHAPLPPYSTLPQAMERTAGFLPPHPPMQILGASGGVPTCLGPPPPQGLFSHIQGLARPPPPPNARRWMDLHQFPIMPVRR